MPFKTVSFFLAVLLFLSILSVQPARAASFSFQEIIPGSFWYPFKILYEDVVTFFTFDNVARARRYLDLANERLAEIKKLQETGNMDAEEIKNTLAEYQKLFNQAKETIIIARQNGEKVGEVLNEATGIAQKNETVLQNLYDEMPEEIKKPVKDALDKTKNSEGDWFNTLKNQFNDQLFNQGRENQKGMGELNNQLQNSIVPNIKNLRIE